MLSIYYFFNPHHFMVLLSFHFIDEETEDEVTCPRKLQTHALALWLSCQKCQDPEGELPNSAARGSLPSPHLKSWGSREQWEGPRAWVKGAGSSLALSYSPLKRGFWARAFQNWMHDGLYIEACHSLVLPCAMNWTVSPQNSYTETLPHNAIYVWRQGLRRYWRLNEVIG